MNGLDHLNDDQRQAATHTEGYLRVVAGAGSGKTKMLVSRYVYLVQELGIDPASILCVTFTNKAAAEMRKRVRAMIGEGYDTGLISTYHGFCARLLREDIEKLFYPSSFQIIDTSDQKDILADIYDELELRLDHASFEKALSTIGRYKDKFPYVPAMMARDDSMLPPDEGGVYARILARYLRKQKQRFALDFDDLIYFALHLLTTDTDVREKWQHRLNYIQVDEFQDSSRREMELIDILSGFYHNLMVVGDPDQNIYEWRGSDVSLLLDFELEHAPLTTVTMEVNYRSTDDVLTCANSLIDHNKLRLKKDLRTVQPGLPCPKPIHYHAPTEHDEAEWIAKRIRQGVLEGRSYADYAVLYRAGHLSRSVENALVDAGIPYEVYGGVAFYKRTEIKDITAYLKLLVSNDDEAFKRIVNKPARKMGRIRIAKLQEMAAAEEPLMAALERLVDDRTFKGSGAVGFLQMIAELRQLAADETVPNIIATVLDKTGYERHIRELGDMERFDNLAEFKQIACEFVARYGEEVSLRTFLDHLALQTDDEFADDGEKVKLMTIHASKGMEFPVVFVVGLSEGIFPSSRSVEDRKQLGLEEERRLCYVAITRAREELYLTDSAGTSAGGTKKLPSRFLFEIGEDNYERIGVISKELREETERYVRLNTPWEESSKPVLPEKVSHPTFGIGEVRSTDVARNQCEVWFPDLGQIRHLSMDFVANHPCDASDEAEASKTEHAPRPTFEAAVSAFDYAMQPAAEPAAPRIVLPSKYRYTELTDDPAETNLWKRSDVPHDSWFCCGVTDLGRGSTMLCQMCGRQHIRYVHHMQHAAYPHIIDAGRVCAGWMEGDPVAAQDRERLLQAKAKRRDR